MLSQKVLDFAKKQYAKTNDRVVVVGGTIYLNSTDEFLSTLDDEIVVVKGKDFIRKEKVKKIKEEPKD